MNFTLVPASPRSISRVPGLLDSPRLDRMPGGPEDPDTAGAMLDDGQDVDLGAVEQAAVKKSRARIPCA